MNDSRIQLEDTFIEIMSKMSEGNPGACTVMLRMLEEGEKIDPQAFAGGLSGILSLDTYRVYGSRIWMLYKDVCAASIVNTLAVLRAVQLGMLPERTLQKAIDNRGKGINLPELLELVKIELREFDRQLEPVGCPS